MSIVVGESDWLSGPVHVCRPMNALDSWKRPIKAACLQVVSLSWLKAVGTREVLAGTGCGSPADTFSLWNWQVKLQVTCMKMRLSETMEVLWNSVCGILEKFSIIPQFDGDFWSVINHTKLINGYIFYWLQLCCSTMTQQCLAHSLICGYRTGSM